MDWLNEHLWETWLGIAILLGVAELFSLDLILIMLAVGAIAGVITGALGAPLVLTVLAAGATSVAMLALVRPPIISRLHTGPELTLGHGKLVGRQALVTQEMSGLTAGRIKLAGEEWSAQPYDETLVIPAGTTVQVLEIRGATAYVYPVGELEA
jgi:membrane protein implicated in regulation of membrane protease activity